ncbi:MAG TPA: ATP-binding cassette domain-containing protein [Alcaligenaceae bacterium]|nr:ATP-binding cassette domain-containing protein [Alcaligenaceae bacterium]
MIRLEQIYKTYVSGSKKITALDDINLEIAAGEVFGIIGRSGAGKSTLIRLLNLLERPSQGQVWLNDEQIDPLSESQLRVVRQKIGMVFQHFNLLQMRTVLDNVCFPLRLAGLNRKQQRERALEVLELVGLKDHVNKYPRQLSGGQQQRVGIARALANRPQLLLCDEATSALDPETTQSILRLLSDINKDLGITIVLITHSMDVIRTICDRVAVIEGGKLVEMGQVLDVFLHPQHEVTQSLLSESGLDADGWQDLAQHIEGRLLRLSFKGDSTSAPVLSQISRSFQMDLSILQGAVSRIKDTPYGQLVVAVKGDVSRWAEVEALLAQNGVDCEVLRP